MLLIAGKMTFDPAHTDALREAAATAMAATLQEDGCQEYNFAISCGDEGTLRIFEIWDSADHLAAHLETPHMAEYRAAMANFGISGRKLTRYEVSDSQPL